MIRDIFSATGNTLRAVGTTAAALAIVGLAACGDSTGPEMSTIQIQLTDAPTDMLSTADVWISHVYLQGGGDDGAAEGDGEGEAPGGRTDLYNDPENPKHFDLLTLQNGVVADLTGEVDVAAGTYGQLRMVVDSAKVTLVEGYEFQNGETTDVLFVPSGMQAGIRVNLNGDIEADADEEVNVIVDFDVDQNFVIQADPQTGIVRQILFTPVLRELRREEEPAS